jgi:branched-chain amino acid transport system permease protein
MPLLASSYFLGREVYLGKLKKWDFKQMNTPHKKFIGLFILLVIIIALPFWVESPYYIHLLIMVGMNSVLAMTFILMLRTGLLSLAIAAFWGVGAYALPLLVMKLDLSVWLALPASAAITGIVALLLGIVLLRNAGFAFVMLTALLGMVTVLVFGTFDVFGGYVGIVNIPPPESILLPFLSPIEFTSKTPYYYLMLFLFILVVVVFSAFYTTWSGRAWRAIDLSPHLAETLGINLFKYRLLAFVVASASAGLMGGFYTCYFGAVVPGTFDMFKTFYIHIYAILGGIGFAFLGPVAGALIMTIVPEILRITKEVEPIYTGLLLILLIMFLPNGLLSLLKHPPPPPENMSKIFRWIRTILPASKGG